MSTALAHRANGSNGLATTELQPTAGVARITEAIHDLKALRTFVAKELVDGHDYGIIPGTSDKKVLLQPGAQKIAMYMQVHFERSIERTEIGAGHVEFFVTSSAILRNGIKIGEGIGSCSTMESKHRFRNANRVCPTCGKDTIIKGKEEYGGGWVCWKKGGGGCNAKFGEKDKAIIDQAAGKVENDNPHDVRNTCLKMAKKRADVDCALGIGAISDLFTQDLDDTFDLKAAEPKNDQQADIQERPATQEQAPRDDTPRTGKAFYRWLKEKDQSTGRKVLESVQKWGATRSYPERAVEWNEDQVAEGFAWVSKKLAKPATEAAKSAATPRSERDEAKQAINESFKPADPAPAQEKAASAAAATSKPLGALKTELGKWADLHRSECREWWSTGNGADYREGLGLPNTHVLLASQYPLLNHLIKWAAGEKLCELPAQFQPATVIETLAPIWDQHFERFEEEAVRYIYTTLPKRQEEELRAAGKLPGV